MVQRVQASLTNWVHLYRTSAQVSTHLTLTDLELLPPVQVMTLSKSLSIVQSPPVPMSLGPTAWLPHTKAFTITAAPVGFGLWVSNSK